ncbi:acyl-CoA oxidase [Pseudohyphozyma bogoriensis]|nr:acyl-CoA oxidase [Pseudohyphozyma bogoriensis]
MAKGATQPEVVAKAAPTPIETMVAERENCPFDLRRMTYAVGGGKYDVELKEKFMVEIQRDPNFKLDDIHDLSKNQLRERTMAKFGSMVHYVVNERLDIFQKRMELISIADPGFWTRFGVHYGLFLGAIRSGATSNQFSYWLEKGVLDLRGMAGCFGMTELAHGSNVAGLETTSTFDEGSDEFIIHTPSVSATKWWIGGAAQTATHCAVFARLKVKGKDYGTKTFIVPLRNPKTFALLPGIAIGDIGKKMGRDGIDNGWIQFTNVRIPRAYMLMKHTQVTRDGQVHEPALAQLTYGALLQGRTAMVADAANVSKKALTIAIRYAAIRRQFKVGHKEFESQILDYPIHQRRLLPLLSQAIAMGFTAIQMTQLYNTMTAQLESFGPDSDESETKEVLERLKETHSTSAGLKAFCTWNGLETIEKARASCGGHGYSAYTGLASMYNDQAVQATWEGDNTILALQAGRSLIAAYGDAKKGVELPGGTAYLNALPKVLSSKCTSDSKAVDLATMDAGWACVAANVVKKASDAYESFLKQGMQKDEALERCSQERFVAAKVHTIGYIFRKFREGIDELAKKEPKESGVVETLERVCRLYGTWSIEENAAHFLKYKFYSSEQMDVISAEVDSLCATLRKCAVPLVDSFNFSDHIINSPLGVYSGDVIKPLLEREPLVLDDVDEMDLDSELAEIREESEEEKKE